MNFNYSFFNKFYSKIIVKIKLFYKLKLNIEISFCKFFFNIKIFNFWNFKNAKKTFYFQLKNFVLIMDKD